MSLYQSAASVDTWQTAVNEHAEREVVRGVARL